MTYPPIKDAPTKHFARCAPVVFKLRGYSAASEELFYDIESSRLAVKPADAMPVHTRSGHIGGASFRAPLARAAGEGVAISLREARGDGAIAASLEGAAQELARAHRLAQDKDRAASYSR